MGLKATFLALVSAQARHSLEEYLFRLYDVFSTERYVSGLVSPDLGRGFLIANAALIVFGFCCYWWPVRRGWPSDVPLAEEAPVVRRLKDRPGGAG